jgi:hypothetical protein
MPCILRAYPPLHLVVLSQDCLGDYIFALPAEPDEVDQQLAIFVEQALTSKALGAGTDLYDL